MIFKKLYCVDISVCPTCLIVDFLEFRPLSVTGFCDLSFDFSLSTFYY